MGLNFKIKQWIKEWLYQRRYKKEFKKAKEITYEELMSFFED